MLVNEADEVADTDSFVPVALLADVGECLAAGPATDGGARDTAVGCDFGQGEASVACLPVRGPHLRRPRTYRAKPMCDLAQFMMSSYFSLAYEI